MATDLKDQAHKLVDKLAEDSTWDDLERLIRERRIIERGIADFEAGRTATSEEVRRRFGLSA